MLLSSIYNFKDYRQFLRAFYNFQKAQDASYSFKKFSLKAKIGSPNLLKLVMDGDKNLSTVSIIKFARGLSLDGDETSFFETLVLENQATDAAEKNYYGKRLRTYFVGGKKGVFKISGKTTLFDKALMPALIVFLAGTSVNEIEKIRKVLPLPHKEIIDMIQTLEEEKILMKKDNRFHVDFDHAIFHRNPSDVKLKTFLRSQLAFSVKAFDKTYERGGKNFSHSMGISKERFPEIIEHIKKMISDVNSNYSFEPAEDVVQINIQTFCLSELCN